MDFRCLVLGRSDVITAGIGVNFSLLGLVNGLVGKLTGA